MMTQGNLEGIPIPFEKTMSDLEMRIMTDIVRAIRVNGFSTAKVDGQIRQMIQLGESAENIKKGIREALEITNDELEKIFSDTVYEQYYGYKRVYDTFGIKQIPFTENLELQALLVAVKAQTKLEFRNITNSMGFALRNPGTGNIYNSPLTDFYRDTLDGAVMDIVSGAVSYDVAINRAINTMTNSGLRTISYDTGHSNRVEVAARRAIMTGFRQVQGKINEQVARDLGTDFYEVTYHRGARPEHQVWQGRVYSYAQLQNVCGLGTVTGLHGANCYHDYNPFIPGISARTYTDEQLAQMMEEENTPKKYLGKEYTTYQALQKQRQMERNMRKTRQDIKLLQEGGANDRSVVSKKARYQLQMQQYKAFSNAIGLPEQMPRVYQDGLGQVSSGKISEKVKQGAKHRLASSQSYKRSLEYVRNGKAGLSKARKALLERVPTENSWTSLKKERVSAKDIAFLSAYTKHEFAIWESKHDMILCHGSQYHCNLPDDIYDLLLSGKYELVAHTHVDMGELMASADDRRLLKAIGQKKSLIVSIDGREKEFYQNMFDDG